MPDIPPTRIYPEIVDAVPTEIQPSPKKGKNSDVNKQLLGVGLGVSLVLNAGSIGVAAMGADRLSTARDENAKLRSLVESQRNEEINGPSEALEIKSFNAESKDPRKNLISFVREVRSGVTIVEFSMAKCYACDKVEPRFRNIAARNKGKFKTLKVFESHKDDALSEIKDFAKVKSFPTFVVFSGGKELGRIGGDNGETYLEGKLLEIIGGAHLN